MVVTDVRAWGFIGYFEVPGKDGIAYYRVPGDKCLPIGKAEWIHKDEGIPYEG